MTISVVNALFNHYVLERGPLPLTEVTVFTQDKLILMTRTPEGFLSPIGVILGSRYEKEVEVANLSSKIRTVKDILGSEIDPTQEGILRSAETLLNNIVNSSVIESEVRNNGQVSVPKIWLKWVLNTTREYNISTDLITSSAFRRSARIILRS